MGLTEVSAGGAAGTEEPVAGLAAEMAGSERGAGLGGGGDGSRGACGAAGRSSLPIEGSFGANWAYRGFSGRCGGPLRSRLRV